MRNFFEKMWYILNPGTVGGILIFVLSIMLSENIIVNYWYIWSFLGYMVVWFSMDYFFDITEPKGEKK